MRPLLSTRARGSIQQTTREKRNRTEAQIPPLDHHRVRPEIHRARHQTRARRQPQRLRVMRAHRRFLVPVTRPQPAVAALPPPTKVMRAVIQRVSQASVIVNGGTVGMIGEGLVILIAIGRNDLPDDTAYLVDKIANLRIFPGTADKAGRFDRSALDVRAELLLISEFTLFADIRKGRRPSFTDAAPPEAAASGFAGIVEQFKATGLSVQTGVFQTHMNLEITNDGPVTITLDTADRTRIHH